MLFALDPGCALASPIAQLLGIPEGLSALVLLTVGYPGEAPAPRPRKPLEEILI